MNCSMLDSCPTPFVFISLLSSCSSYSANIADRSVELLPQAVMVELPK